MPKIARRSRQIMLESLEDRKLLTLIGAKPTLHILEGPGVHNLPSGRVNILQPAQILVYGTAQPGAPGTTVTVGIYAEDRNGNIINGGQPLATTTPDALGRYGTSVTLPSNIRRDINYLVAREDASATEVSQLAINGTTFTSTSGSLTNGSGTLNASTSTITNGSATLGAHASTIVNGSASLGASTSTITNGSATLGAQSGTITNGSGTLGASAGTFAQTGTITIGGGGGGTITGLTGTILTPATGITGISGTIATTPTGITGLTGTLNTPATGITGLAGTINTPATGITGLTGSISNPATPVTGITGTISVAGTIAPTTGTDTRFLQETLVSDPVVVLIHQPRGGPGVVGPLAHHQGHVAAQRSFGHVAAQRSFGHVAAQRAFGRRVHK